jgi:nucleoside-triphosphatase
MKSAYLLTGMPGTGKTTLIREAVQPLGDKAGGFYTEEIRLQGVRQGFRLVTLDGQTAVLAQVNIHSPHKVSKYGVDVEALERIGVTALYEAARKCDVVVIDEIGKMELYSARFKTAVLEILDNGKPVLGTVMLKSDPWADAVKQKPQVTLTHLTRNNHSPVLQEVREWLHNYLK